MTTPLEQIKERLEKMRNTKEHICRFNDGECNCDCYNACLTDIQAILPSIIQEVGLKIVKELEPITRCAIYGCDSMGTITNSKGEPEPCECCDARNKLIASLKEESK